MTVSKGSSMKIGFSHFFTITGLWCFCLMMAWHYSIVKTEPFGRSVATFKETSTKTWYDSSFKL